MSDYLYQKLLDGTICRKYPDESTETQWAYIIHHSDNMHSGNSDTNRPRIFWIEISVCRHVQLAINHEFMQFAYNWSASSDCYYVFKMNINGASTIFTLTLSAIKGLRGYIVPMRKEWRYIQVSRKTTCSLLHSRNKWHRRVYDFWSCNWDGQWAVERLQSITIVSAACMVKWTTDDIAATSQRWASTECPLFFVLHHR